MPLSMDDPVVKDALVGILMIETSQKFSRAPEKVRRSQLLATLNVEKAKGEEALQALKSLGYARFVLFGCVELTTSGRLAALQASTRT